MIGFDNILSASLTYDDRSITAKFRTLLSREHVCRLPIVINFLPYNHRLAGTNCSGVTLAREKSVVHKYLLRF